MEVLSNLAEENPLLGIICHCCETLGLGASFAMGIFSYWGEGFLGCFQGSINGIVSLLGFMGSSQALYVVLSFLDLALLT